MPYRTEWEDPEIFLHAYDVNGKDVIVYYTYKNDEIEQGTRTYSFTLDPAVGDLGWGGFSHLEGPLFDVRDFPDFREWTSGSMLPLEKYEQTIRRFIVSLIERGIITSEGITPSEVRVK